MEIHFFRELIKTLKGDYRNWEERNGFIPSDHIKPISDLREGYQVEVKEIVEEGRSQKTVLEKRENIQVEEKDIFESIIGYDSLKVIFRNTLSSNEVVHILLTGLAGTAKSLFLEAIAENVKRSYFITNNSTGAGIIQYLYDHPELRYLCIDEIEKIGKYELSVLLTLMETSKLIVQKKTMSVNRIQNLTIFATCNNKYRLAPEILSRFLKFHLQPYKYPEFVLITKNVATKKFKRTTEFGEAVANSVWNDMGSRDVRDCIKIMKLAKKEDDIIMIIEAIQQYRENKKE